MSSASSTAEESLLQVLLRRLDLLVDLAAVDVGAVALERARPRGNRVAVAPQLEEHLAVVLLDDRVGSQLVGRAVQVVLGEIDKKIKAAKQRLNKR